MTGKKDSINAWNEIEKRRLEAAVRAHVENSRVPLFDDPGPKILRDYPFEKWMKAADGCEFCDAPYFVKVTWVEDDGLFGDVLIRPTHGPGCMELFEPHEEYHDVAGWEFEDHKIKVAGKEWTSLKGRANIGPCLNCLRLVVGVPLILFIDEGRKGHIDFCFGCARDLGILDRLVPSDKGPMRLKEEI